MSLCHVCLGKKRHLSKLFLTPTELWRTSATYRFAEKDVNFSHSHAEVKLNLILQVNLCRKLLFLHQLLNPQYDDRLFIEFQVQYMKIPSSTMERTGRHGILIFSCLLFVLFEKIENLIKKTNPDILHQIAKSRNPD